MSLYEWLGVAGIAIGGYYALVKVIVSQFKSELGTRFDAQEALREAGQQEWAAQFRRIDGQMERFQTELSTLQQNLPIAYVRREDAIRENTVINAKLDALNEKLDKLADRRMLARPQEG